MPPTSVDLKRRAALRALDFVEPGFRLGLGSGSTAEAFVEVLAARVADGLDVTCVATSARTQALAQRLGIRMTSLEAMPQLDLTIDGADEIDPQLRLIKGGGGALLREKITACASTRMIVIADRSKLVATLGAFPLPLEAIAFGLAATLRHVGDVARQAGCAGRLVTRKTPAGVDFLTDSGNLIIDCAFGRIPDPDALARGLAAIPGVVEHGLFIAIASQAVIAGEAGVDVFAPHLSQTGVPQ